jgi:hypothetical protein
LSLSTPQRYIGGVEVQLHIFSTSAQMEASQLHGRFAPEKGQQYQLNRRLSGSISGLDILKK